MLSISALFLGTALTIRDLVGERNIFRREQAAGLSASAYLVAKILVYSVAAAVQIAVVTAIVVIGTSAPTRGAVILGNPTFELYATLALTAAVAAIIGLALSAAATSQDQILPMLVISVMLSIVFGGGDDSGHRSYPSRPNVMAPGRPLGLRRVGVHRRSRTIAPILQTNDRLWSHASNWWLLDMTMLATNPKIMATLLWLLGGHARGRDGGAQRPTRAARPPGLAGASWPRRSTTSTRCWAALGGWWHRPAAAWAR